MFIDQLAMIQEKTRGNLSTEEAGVLRNTLANLQMAFVEVSQSGAGGKSPRAQSPQQEAPRFDERESTTAAAPAEAPASSEQPAPAPESESRKKFTKSYGA